MSKRRTKRNADGTASWAIGMMSNGDCEKLCDFEDAEEQGRLLYLPCRIGDKIYCVRAFPCDRGIIGECPYPELGCEECRFISHIIEEQPFRLSCLDEAGRLRKGLFVNRDEAEEYLKEQTKI